MHDDDLSPEERAGFRALSREVAPRHALEDRTVRRLRSEGLLQRPQGRVISIHFTPSWITAAAAACLALFFAGFAMGGWFESRHTTDVMAQIHEQDATRAAALVQQTGSAYVSALATLASLNDKATAGNPQIAQGKEVAVNALHAAASQLVRIAPDDPISVRILAGMKKAAGDSSAAARLVWF
jgi:hypothetical protein